MHARGMSVPLSVCASEDALPADALPAGSGRDEEDEDVSGFLCSSPDDADCAAEDEAADEDAGGFCGRGFADALPCPPVCADGCDEAAGGCAAEDAGAV